ncbi:hypothetical protein AAVH_38225 [Aphelenchoides avenae]|nr:hypothetical protein AAVH_38225 [Aphelenchus avenae]
MQASTSSSWPLLSKYVVGIRSYYNAMRSAYFLENPEHVFSDPPFVRYGVPEWMDKERKFAPILFNIVNEQFFLLTQLAVDDQKRVYRRFTNGFSELFCCWMTAKQYPLSARVFVSHYGYYLDYDDFVGFYEANGSTADAYDK